MPEFGVGAEPEYFELWLADGSLFQRSPSFELSDQTRPRASSRVLARRRRRRFRDVRLPDGRRGRQIQLDFVPSLDPEDESGRSAGAARRAASRIRGSSRR